MPNKLLSFACLIGLAFSLGACSTLGLEDVSEGTPQVVAAPDKVSAMLAQAADRASSALEELAAVEQTRTPSTAAEPVSNAPAVLQRAITVNWVGPVEQITKTLAERASYGFKVFGNAPPTPLVVSIDAENKPVIDVLRDIGLQMGQRANLRVDAPARNVELHYIPQGGIGG